VKLLKHKDNLTWREAILNVLLDHEQTEVTLSQIYSEISHYRELTPNDLQFTYGQRNYTHKIRRILTDMIRNNEVIRTKKGTYVLNNRLK